MQIQTFDFLCLRRHARPVAATFALTCALFAIFACALPARAGQWHAPQQYGVRCQDGFQDQWLPTIDTYGMCSNFINQIRGTDPVAFYYDLVGAANSFNNGDWTETCLGCGGVDSVDFYLLNTHGGTNTWGAAFGMWDNGSLAWSPLMRLGAAGEQVKVFATYACDTLYTADNLFWQRWSAALSGGVKVLLGAHDLVYDGNSQKGTEFASRMQDGEPIGQSWLEAVWYADNDNHPSEANVGANPNDCWNRAGINLPGLPYLPALRDGQIGWVCWAGWNGS